MKEFGFLKKLINLTKLSIEGVKYQVRLESIMSEAFNLETVLKQEDALSPLLFNIALEKAVRVLRNETREIKVDEYHIEVLGFADNLNILEASLDDKVRATKALKHAAERIGLHINVDKTKLMKLLDMETSLDVLDTLPYEKIEQFQYLGTLLNTKNEVWFSTTNTSIYVLRVSTMSNKHKSNVLTMEQKMKISEFHDCNYDGAIDWLATDLNDLGYY
jgi:hypothetical protein